MCNFVCHVESLSKRMEIRHYDQVHLRMTDAAEKVCMEMEYYNRHLLVVV